MGDTGRPSRAAADELATAKKHDFGLNQAREGLSGPTTAEARKFSAPFDATTNVVVVTRCC
jgi:hypothetical protein